MLADREAVCWSLPLSKFICYFSLRGIFLGCINTSLLIFINEPTFHFFYLLIQYRHKYLNWGTNAPSVQIRLFNRVYMQSQFHPKSQGTKCYYLSNLGILVGQRQGSQLSLKSHWKLPWEHNNQEEVWCNREECHRWSAGWRKEQTLLSKLKALLRKMTWDKNNKALWSMKPCFSCHATCHKTLWTV